MTELPLISMDQSLEIYKNVHAENPSFGMDIFEKDFKVDNLLILENNGKEKASPYTRCGYYIMIFSLKGKSIHYVNQYDYEVNENSLQLIVPGAIHRFEDISEEQNSYILLFKKDYFEEELKELLDYHRFNLAPISILSCDLVRVKYLFEHIDQEYKKKNKDYKEIAKCFVAQLLYILKHQKLSLSKTHVKNRSEQIMAQYLDLIEEHYQSKKTVTEYADILELTAKHLGETVKELTGKPALYYIHIRILKETKYLLVYTNLSVKEISYMLNFENASDFGRFFKRLEGISPSKYRLSYCNP